MAARGAAGAGRADRGAPARLHHGERGGRPIHYRPGRRSGAGAACAERSGGLRRSIARAARRALSQPAGRHCHRQLGARVAARHRRRRARRRRAAGADGFARAPRSVRARAARHPNRIRRRDRQRRVAHHGAGGRGAADGAGARARLVGSALARRSADPLGRGGLVPVSAAGDPRKTLVVALCGGGGGAKVALGVRRGVRGADLMVVANTGDDFEHLGLAISPDLDTIMYTLAGLADPQRGWGRHDETWTFMAALAALGGETWFALGDGDLATHLERTRRRAAGEALSAITADFCRRLQISPPPAPITADPPRDRP